MPIFKRRKKNKSQILKPLEIQTRSVNNFSINHDFNQSAINESTINLYKSMRSSIPIIDAAFGKIERLIGGFTFFCDDPKAQRFLNDFSYNVKVGASRNGLEHFICTYLDSLLMFGNAIGEIIFDDGLNIAALYNADISDIVLVKGKNPLDLKICRKNGFDAPIEPKFPERILFTALNPMPGKIGGESVLNSLPFVTNILNKIYNAIGENFERIGNVRFAVTYKPGQNEVDQAYARQRAELIAKEWAQGMAATKRGDIRDFVTIGDVDIKVIGADNQIIDYEIPARQMVEQIISKLSIPPFMLGLSWSTTERMSEQQAQILSSELAYYRRLLNPIILKIATIALRTSGYSDKPKIKWDILNFNDQIQAAQTRLYNAQAEKIELENGKDPEPVLVDLSEQVVAQ